MQRERRAVRVRAGVFMRECVCVRARACECARACAGACMCAQSVRVRRGGATLQADGQAYSSSDSARAVVDDGDQYTGPSPRNTHPCSARQAGIPERF